ncbi:MAG TPA: RNA 2',3'-cyclic phosphodiesterase [Burkholderiales bacterium]|nr:RNA 2',3'-cyclic phosphodiesterase [Burkholderiales bacterium]
MRLFFALWPPRETALALGQWAQELAQECRGKHTIVDNIHLTLAFLGEADPAKATAAGRRVTARRHALAIDAARYVKRNEMVWVGPAAVPPELGALAAELHGGLKAAGFTLEERPFAAHVTLVRKARMPGSIPPLPRVAWPVNEMLLMRSRTSPKGSSYEPVERFPLRP